MKKFFLLLILFCSIAGYAQDWNAIAKDDLLKQKEAFNALEVTYNDLESQRKTTQITNITLYDTIIKKLRAIVPKIDSLYYKREKSIDFYTFKDVNNDSLKSFFVVPNYKPLAAQQATPKVTEQKKEVFIMVGKGKIIREANIRDEDAKLALSEVFSENSVSYIGDFEIPGNKQKVSLYEKRKFVNYVHGDKLLNQGDHLYFEQVKVSIREGAMYDIRVMLTDSENKHKYYFSNAVPISLLRYMKKAKTSYLINTLNNPNERDLATDDRYENYVIRLSDVLRYFNNTGNNYVQDNEDYCFPPATDSENSNPDVLRLYKIKQDTNLQNIVELRTFTDFLGLFDEDSPNGIVQIEGRADFYLAPFQIGNRFPFTLFKKTTPYVNFAKIEEDVRNVAIEATEADPLLFKVSRPLDLIEKAYLDMGVITDIIGFSLTKEFPFSFNFYLPIRYKVSTLEWADSTHQNFKTVGYGGGIRIEAKRFNNFGFTNSSEWSKFNHVNRIENLEIPDNFWVFRNESEIFYYPNKNKAQSIFLRLRSYFNTTDTEDSFFQLQFGYRFSLGLSKKD